ncbi:MAG: hypothetical protein U1E19_03300 [Rhodoblastus sp.]
MRILGCLVILLALSGCMTTNEAQMPDPAARGGGIVGGEPPSPYTPTR